MFWDVSSNFILQLFRFLRATFAAILSSIAQNLSVNEKDTSNLFKLVLFSLIAWKRVIWLISCVSELSMTKQLLCKLEVLQPSHYSALTFRDFVPRLELLTLFRDFRRSMKMCEMNYFSLFCKSYLVLFLTFIIGTPILCCAITDLGIFGTVLGIFWVSFVRESPANQVRQFPNSIRSGIAENVGFWPSPHKRKLVVSCLSQSNSFETA